MLIIIKVQGGVSMLSKVNSIALIGIDGFVVNIEVDIQNGLPVFNMVGLPDMIIKESKERVKAAIKNSGYEFPLGKITVNFAPADIKKEGPHFDLAIAMGILLSNNTIDPFDTRDCIFIGELSLNGEVRGVKGILPMVLEAKRSKYKRVFIPRENENELVFVNEIEILPVSTLNELVDYINGYAVLKKVEFMKDSVCRKADYDIDFNEVKGQKLSKRAIEVACCGGHNILMIGPPGGGKTMLSQRVPTILPFLNYNQSIEVTRIYSVAGMIKERGSIMLQTPFRNPHHSASTASIIGGGSNPMPGEVSLAHNGVLFLDELPEFRRDALEALRQPMEDGRVCISRAKGKYTYPASFMLIASMNPCPCGYYGYQLKQCKCTEVQIRSYLNRVSGPLLDRIDIHISVEPIQFDEINNNIIEESSENIRKRVEKARIVQQERFKGEGIQHNAQMKTKHLKKYCELDSKGEALLKAAFKSMSLSTRAYSKILKISRTIADMDDSINIRDNHIAEALQYRILDRKYWG